MSITNIKFMMSVAYVQDTDLKKSNIKDLKKQKDKYFTNTKKNKNIKNQINLIKSTIGHVSVYEEHLNIIKKYKEQQIIEIKTDDKKLYAERCIEYITKILRLDLVNYKILIKNRMKVMKPKSWKEYPEELKMFRNFRDDWGPGYGLNGCWFLENQIGLKNLPVQYVIEKYYNKIYDLLDMFHSYITKDITDKLPDIDFILSKGFSLDIIIGLAHTQVVNMIAKNPTYYKEHINKSFPSQPFSIDDICKHGIYYDNILGINIDTDISTWTD